MARSTSSIIAPRVIIGMGAAQMGEASSGLKASASRRSGVDTMVRTCGHDAPRERRSGRAEGRLGSVSRGQVGGAGLGLQDVP